MNKSHFAKYIEETSGRKMYEDDKGFFIYQINNKEFYVQEVFVLEEYRGKGVAKEYDKKAVEMAREFGCDYIKGSVISGQKNATDSMKFQLALGYKIAYSDNHLIYLIKKVGE